MTAGITEKGVGREKEVVRLYLFGFCRSLQLPYIGNGTSFATNHLEGHLGQNRMIIRAASPYD